MTTTYRLTGTLLAGCLAFAAEAGAQLFNCGDAIGPKEKVTLTADVETCTSGTDPALTITGPATVDMAGHSVICDPNDPSAKGILIVGKGVKLLAGGVRHCNEGLVVDGEGKHKIEDFAVEDCAADGIHVSSGKNKFKRVSSIDNGNDGMEINGSGNKIEDVVVSRNAHEGFEIEQGKNQLKRIAAVQNGRQGLLIDGGSQTKVKDGVFIRNDDDGVEMVTGVNKIEKSIAIQNGLDHGGFDSQSDPGQGPNQIKKCRAHDHAFFGIRTASQGDKITNNTAFGNDVDLVDENAACDGNQWKKNVFGESEADGVGNPACIE